MSVAPTVTPRAIPAQCSAPWILRESIGAVHLLQVVRKTSVEGQTADLFPFQTVEPVATEQLQRNRVIRVL